MTDIRKALDTATKKRNLEAQLAHSVVRTPAPRAAYCDATNFS